MKYALIILWIACGLFADAQQIKQEEDKIFRKVELSAQFPSGEAAWVRFIERNFDFNAVLAQLSDSIREFTDSLVIQFIVNKKGLIEDPETTVCRSSAFKEGMLSLLKKSTVWQPEIQGSGPVKSYVSYLFVIVLLSDMNTILVIPAKFPKQPNSKKTNGYIKAASHLDIPIVE